MTTNGTPALEVNKQPEAATGLALVRMTIGAMLVWVFFENLGKGLYTPAGYAGLINSYIKSSHSPAVWKAVMGQAASHAAIAAPMRDSARHRSAYPSGRIGGVSVSRQPLDFGVGYLVDLGTAGSGAGISWARDRTRRPQMGR
jgi:hypothetical protein